MHDRVGVVIGGVQHTDGPLQVKYWGGPDPCDPCGVDAYADVKEGLGCTKHMKSPSAYRYSICGLSLSC